MGFDAYMFDMLKEDTESRFNKSGNDNSTKSDNTGNNPVTKGSNNDHSMAEAEKIADTSIGNNDVSATTKRTEIALEDLDKSKYIGNGLNIEYDAEFLDYQNKIIDSINIAYSSKPLYQYLVKQINAQRGKNNSYSGPKIDTTAVSTIKVPTYLINCLKQETSSLTKVKNGTMVVGFLVWYLGLNPDDFEDSEDITLICNSLGVSASPSKLTAHTGNMMQNLDDRLNDFEDAMTRLTHLVEHVNTNMSQSEQEIGKVLMLSCYNALSLIGRATLVKSNESLDDIDLLDNMKVWSLMKAVESAWLYNSRSEGREQYKRKCERDRKQVLYASNNNQIVGTSNASDSTSGGSLSGTGGSLRMGDDIDDYSDSEFDPNEDYGDPEDEQLFSFGDDDQDDYANIGDVFDDDDDSLEETIAVGNINNLKNTDPAKYLKYMKEHRNEN